MLLVLGAVMGFVWGRPEAGRQPLRMMTYNIKSYVAEETGKGFGPLLDEIGRQHPDLLVMQDALDASDAPTGMPRELQAFLKGWHTWQRGQYVVASRLPLRQCREHDMTAGQYPSEFVSCVVATPVGDIDVVTAHLVSPRNGLNATRFERLGGLPEWRYNYLQRLSQAQHVAAYLRSPMGMSSRPLIVAGDLNAPEASPVVRGLLALGLRDVFSTAGRGWGYTHGHSLRPHLSFLRIDHILVSDRLSVAAAWAGGKEGSEHRPVVADLWLEPQR